LSSLDALVVVVFVRRVGRRTHALVLARAHVRIAVCGVIV
jgi:hypothetical protein